MPTRNGEIARLPNAIREQLNLRLLDGETGRELAVWLNALPEVQSMLGSQFSGAPISEVNLTHWRQGGCLQWLTERECFESARALAEGDGDLATTGLSAERLLNVLTLRFGQLLMRWDFPADESISASGAFTETAKKARILQGISRSVLAMHRIQSKSALAAARPGSHGTPEQNTTPIPAIDRCLAEANNAGASRSERTPVSSAKATPAKEDGMPQNGTIFSPVIRSARPNILSGPIIPSSLSSSPYNPGHDLEEVLNAV